MIGGRLGTGLWAWVLVTLSSPVAATGIDLSQLCSGWGGCVVSTNTTIVSASGPLDVRGHLTVNSGVVLEFRVPITVNVSGDMVLAGTVGAPGDGGAGGAGGNAGQPGGAGQAAPAVVSAVFNVTGAITLDASAAAVAEGGSGGNGGLPGFGSSTGGAGGAGGAGGSLTFNACKAVNNASGARIRVNGGAGGVGAAGALGGAGGAGGSVFINAKETIVSNAAISAVGGVAGSGGAGAGSAGASGTITLSALGTVTAGTGTLDAGTNSPTINASQASVGALSYCVTPAPIPTLSQWVSILLAGLMVMFAAHRLLRRPGFRSNPRI